MYVYEFGYDSPEESPYVLLSHEIAYSEEEFAAMCVSCYKKAGVETNAIQNIWKQALKMLINDYLFQPIIPDVRFQPFGWGTPNCKTNAPENWKEYWNRFNEYF